MTAIENFLLLCGIQAFVISVALLIGVVVLRVFARRRSTTFVAAGLASMVLLWLVACLPYDGWLTPQRLMDAGSKLAKTPARNIAVAANDLPNSAIAEDAPVFNSREQATVDGDSTLAQITALTLQQIQQLSQPTKSEANSFDWKRILVWLALVTIGIGIVRLLVAYLTIWRLFRSSRRLADDNALALLTNVQRHLNCGRTVQLFEAAETQAAFTVGWLRPKICLSDCWRTWEPKELEATLAHEVAHISSGDFLQRVIAQLSAALNFYNPIVHYLCGQLCIDQEFNADARAAEVVGGQKSYLNTLASLALQNDYSNHRLAPMFLPTRKSFFRRIEMLRSKQISRVETPLVKIFSLLVVGMIVVSVAGFRFPESSSAAARSDSSSVQQDTPANLRFVPGDADAIIVVRPAKLLQSKLLSVVFDAFKKESDQKYLFNEMLRDLFGVPADSINQLTCFITDIANHERRIVVFVIQSREAGWWVSDDVDKQMQDKLVASPESSFRGHKIYFSDKPVLPHGAYHVADDKTLVCAIGGSRMESLRIQRAIKSAIRASDGPNGNWSTAWQEVSDRDISLVALNDSVDALQTTMHEGRDIFSPMLRPILESADFVVASLNHTSNSTDIEATIHCAEGSDIESAEEAVIGIKAYAKSLLKSAKRGHLDYEDPPLANRVAESFLDLPLVLLDALKINSDSNRIVVKSQLTENQHDLLRPLAPAISLTRANALKIESMNNARQLTLGLLNFEAAFGHYPPPVLTSKHGKKYSWRIAILPFIEGQHIHDRYRFDEDWNSEHNMMVTSQVPRVFQHPSERKVNSKHSSYFLITGEETPFHGNDGTRLSEIRDGTSNTICIVEAKKNVHWAQPRDIQFNDGKLDTELGGYGEETFTVSMCDGSARFISKDLDKNVLNALIMSSDGQVVDQTQIK